MATVWNDEYTKTFHHATYPSISPTRPELSAAGKTIMISGGGRGIGTGIVEAFAQAGAEHIIVLGRSVSTLSAAASSVGAAYPSVKISTVAGDVSEEADMARAFAEVAILAPAGIDVYIANAGYLPTVAPIAPAVSAASSPSSSSSSSSNENDDSAVTADWWRAFEVNVKGVYLQARHFLANAAAGSGAPVFANISAGVAHLYPAFPGFSHYAAAKLGAARLVETLQVEHSGAVRFYNVHPGCVRSDMLTKSGLEGYGDALPLDEHELPGHFLVWLSSPEAEFLKGKFVWVNWDVDELKARKEEIMAPNKLVTGLAGWD